MPIFNPKYNAPKILSKLPKFINNNIYKFGIFIQSCNKQEQSL